MTIIKRVIKWAIMAMVIAVYVGGIALLIINRDPAMAKTDIWTEDALSVYRSDPDGYQMYSIKLDPNYTPQGTFFVSNLRYSPTSRQYTLTVRFNKSTLKYCAQTYETESALDWDCFTYFLRDGDGNVIENPSFIHLEKSRHHYLRMVFDGVAPESVESLSVVACYQGNEYGEISLWNERSKKTEYRIRKGDLPQDGLCCTPDLQIDHRSSFQ